MSDLLIVAYAMGHPTPLTLAPHATPDAFLRGHRASPRPYPDAPGAWWGDPHHRTPGPPISATAVDSYRRTAWNEHR